MFRLQFLVQEAVNSSRDQQNKGSSHIHRIFLGMLGSRRVAWCIGFVLVVAALGASAEDADQAEKKPSKVKVRPSSLSWRNFQGGGVPPTSSSSFGRRDPTLTCRLGLSRRC